MCREGCQGVHQQMSTQDHKTHAKHVHHNLRKTPFSNIYHLLFSRPLLLCESSRQAWAGHCVFLHLIFIGLWQLNNSVLSIHWGYIYTRHCQTPRWFSTRQVEQGDHFDLRHQLYHTGAHIPLVGWEFVVETLQRDPKGKLIIGNFIIIGKINSNRKTPACEQTNRVHSPLQYLGTVHTLPHQEAILYKYSCRVPLH